jgi:hypothetical protein
MVLVNFQDKEEKVLEQAEEEEATIIHNIFMEVMELKDVLFYLLNKILEYLLFLKNMIRISKIIIP